MLFRSGETTDRPFEILGLLRSEGTITQTTPKILAQARQLQGFFLVGGRGSHSQYLGAGEGHRLTLATDMLPQCMVISSKSLTRRTRYLKEPTPLEKMELT